jgi:hypothetical protein
MEYFLINLPKTLGGENPTSLIKALTESADIFLFDNLAIQSIINYKWNTYTRKFFLKQLIIFIVFILLFGFDTLYLM